MTCPVVVVRLVNGLQESSDNGAPKPKLNLFNRTAMVQEAVHWCAYNMTIIMHKGMLSAEPKVTLH